MFGPPLGVGARVIGAFGAVIVAFAAALVFSARAQQEVLDQLDEVRREEAWARALLRLGSAVREQYSHQAHTIIRGDREHLTHYAAASALVHQELAGAREAAAPEDRTRLDAIAESERQLDLVFRNQIVAGIDAADWPKVRLEHERAQQEVESIVSEVASLEKAASARVGAAREAAGAALRSARRRVVALFAAAVAVAVAMGAFVVRSVVRPLRRLGEGARRIGEGDLSTRIGLTSRDELGALSARFDEMARRLQADREALVAAEKLAGLGRLAAGVAHELNNPLAVVLGYVRLLRKRAAPDVQEDLEVVDEEVVRCQEIVSELLGLAREGQKQRFEPVDLGALAAEVARRQASGVDEGLAPVELETMPALPVVGDPDRLAQVIANLLRNGRQAAAGRGRVRLQGRAGEASVELSVEDDGPGLSEEARARIFEPFFTTKEAGTGLGLAVSLAIAQAHRGTIEAENRAEGGARFTLRLPAGGAHE